MRALVRAGQLHALREAQVTGWSIKSKAERVRIATKASRVAAEKRTADAQRRRESHPVKAEQPPATRRDVRRDSRTCVLVRTNEGWTAPAKQSIARLTERELDLMGLLAGIDRFDRGCTMLQLAAAHGVPRNAVSNVIHILRRKFGVPSRRDLIPIAKELSRNKTRRRAAEQLSNIRGRGGPGNRVSKFANPVSDGPASAGADAATRTEALHPGPHASRVL